MLIWPISIAIFRQYHIEIELFYRSVTTAYMSDCCYYYFYNFITQQNFHTLLALKSLHPNSNSLYLN